MSEFETGGLQEMSDIAFKEVYDIMKYEKMFDTPETIGEAASQVWWGAVAEGIGGFVMGTPGAVRSALRKGKITELSDGEYEAFEKVMEDENLRGAYEEKLKQDVLSGKKSQQEAIDEWNESEKVKGDMDLIPDSYTPEQKKKALELLIKKSKLQDIVDKGNKQLVTKEQAEIDAINDTLTAMSTETDTSSTTETDADGYTTGYDATVDEASAKIKLQEEGIKDPTQEQIDAKQAEMLEEGISQENLSAIDNLAKNTDSSGRLENRNKDLFGETQETSQGSAVLSDITESNENGVATGTYTNTETGDVDVVVSSKGKSDFVSFSRIYEDGKPTNSWSSKMINEAGSDFVTMLTEAQKLLPEGHQWTESKSISESGLGVWNKALKKGYEAQVDSEGNVITKSVTLNEAEKGKSTSDSSDFNDVIVETKSEADAKIKELEGIYPGIVAKPVRVRDGKGRIKGLSFKVELPVLVKGKTETKDNTDVTIDKAREGDVEAQEKLAEYGLKWAKETIYRFVGKSEVDALEKGETIEGKSKAAGVDVTSSSEVTSASDADYRITFKEEGFDDKKKGSRVRMKSEKDGWVKGGYNKSDVLKIEKKNEDGTYETVYDSEAEVEVEAEAEVEVDVATQIKNLQKEAKALIAAEKSKGLPAYSKKFIQEDKKRRDEIKRLKGLIAKKAPKKKPAPKTAAVKLADKIKRQQEVVDELEEDVSDSRQIWESTATREEIVKSSMENIDDADTAEIRIKLEAAEKKLAELKAPKKKAKVKSVQEEEAPKKRVVTPLQGESMQDAVRRTRGTKKAKGAKKSTPEGLVYTGAFVNDTESLSKKYPSELPNKEGGHMTVSFKPNDLDVTTGEKTSLKVVGRLTTDKVDVLILENDKSTNETPHITLATAKGVSPATSNQEIKNNEANRLKENAVWYKTFPLDETVEATYGYFDSKAGNVISLQNEVQDKEGAASTTKGKSISTRTGGTGATSKVSRYDVGRSDRVVGDDTVVKKFNLSEKEESSLVKAMPGRAVIDAEFYEVNDPKLFHKQISESKKNNKYAASVFVYSVKEYANSRLFLTPDGKAGLAITEDGDIISVFSYGEGKGRVPQLIVNAIKEGAVSLDHYDTVLTNYYAKFGFKPVAKVKWNNDFAPEGWSKKVFKAFNKGEPDVVAMVYDGGNRNTIAERVGTFKDVKVSLDKAPYVEEWDEAKALQDKAKMPPAEKKVVRTAKPLTKKEEEAAEAEFIKIAGKPKSKKRAAWVKKENKKAKFRLKTKAAEDSESNPADVKKFLSFLNLSFPNVTISTNLQEFNEIIETDGVKTYLKGGEILYGVTTEGDIYINPDTNNSDSELYNTAIHEMSHIWTDYLETTEKGREVLAKGVELVKETDTYQEQLEEFDGDTEAAAREALSILIGNKGQTIAKSSIKSRFEKWLRGVWNYIKKKFKVSTKTKVEDLTLDEFIDLSLSDILGGKEIKTTPEQREAMRSLAKFSKKGSKSDLTKLKNVVVKAIKDIRAQGKSESAIKTLLENRGLEASLITELMAKEKGAPSQTTKILGKIESDKISISEADLLKAQIKAFNKGAKDMKSTIKKASAVLAKEVEALVKKGKITTQQAARIITKFAKTDVTSETQVDGFVDYMTNIYNKSEDSYRNALIVKIQKLIKKNTKVTRTAANRIKGKGLEAESQQFFAAMNRVLNRILETRKGKPVAVNPIEIAEDFFPDIEVILQKDPNSLTTKENSQLFAYMSFNSLEGIRSMTLEEVEQLLEDVKLGTKGGRSELQEKRMQEKAVIDEVKAKADAAINEGYAELLNPDGTYKNVNLVNDRSDEAQRIKSRNRSVLDDIKTWKKNFIFTDLSKWINNLGNNLKNLATLTNSLDKEGDFFSKNVHKPLVKMETDTIKGIESEKINKLDEIAGSIEGVKNYKAILRLLSRGINSKVEGITDSDGNPYENTSFPLDILLRWYALSKNKVQMDKLKKQGLTKEKILEIKTELGPELVEFADKIIEYLSSEYFESINKVYKLVNNVNLVQIENYFPTQSVLQSVKSSLIESGDWNAVLAKMNESATKERTNTKGDVLLTATDFTTALESHLEEMERYKAYAEGSLRLEKIFKFPSVNALLKTLGVMDSVKNAINFAINPDGGRASIMSGPMDKLMTKYTGFALATKFMQIGKQATSWIWSFEKYNFRGEGKTRVPGLDLTMYMVDSAKTLLTLPWQIRKAYKMSAVFRDRIRKAFEGDVRGLESGSRTAKEQRRTRKSIWKKFLKFLLGSTTTVGDIVGVSGYMVTYNRDIQNGMDPEVALAKFEEYNTTQQSRMNVDKNPLQMNSNYAVRGFTMFGSTLFLQINKVMQNTTNIQRAMRKFTKTGKAKDLPTQEMFRGMFLAAGVANVFFVAMANSFKYIQGGEDDKEEVMQRMMDAMLGLNLIYQIPYLGSTVEEAVNKSRGLYRPGDSVVNPLTSFFRKFGRLQKKAEKKGNDSDLKTMENSLRLLLELNFGFQFDFFEGIYESFGGDFDDETMYKVLGVSSSYQPRDSGPDNINLEDKAPKISKEKKESDSFTNDGFDGGFEDGGFDEGFEDDGF
jgi:hypothetical protein